MNTPLQAKSISIFIILSYLIMPTAYAHTGDLNLNVIIGIWHSLSHGTQLAESATHFALIPATLTGISVFLIGSLIHRYQRKTSLSSFWVWISSSLATFGLVGYLA